MSEITPYVSTIADGNMHPFLDTAETAGQAYYNFTRYCANLGVTAAELTGVCLVPPGSTTDTREVATLDAAEDGLMAVRQVPQSGLVLPRAMGALTLSGDCFPMQLAAGEDHVIGHAGWRQTDRGLLPAMIETLQVLGYNQSDMQLWIGPGIAADSNKMPVANALQLNGPNRSFWQAHVRPLAADGSLVTVDIGGALINQAVSSGLTYQQIECDTRDTYSDAELFSRRATVVDSLPVPRGNHAVVFPPQA